MRCINKFTSKFIDSKPSNAQKLSNLPHRATKTSILMNPSDSDIDSPVTIQSIFCTVKLIFFALVNAQVEGFTFRRPKI